MAQDSPSLFDFLGDEVLVLIQELIEKSGLDEAELEEALPPILKTFMAELTPSVAAALLKGSKAMLRERRADEAGFQKRNSKRWAKSFSRVEFVWHLCEEIGREFNQKYRPDAVREQNMLFEALVNLHARGLLVAAEAIHLLKGGFAEGSLTRWRALHEVLVVSMFIREHGPMAAERYLHSAHFLTRTAARQYMAFHDRAKLSPIKESDLEQLDTTCTVLAEKYGKIMYQDNGWALPFFPAKTGELRAPNFSDLEKAVGLDHWRPRYKWASQHTHAGSRHAHANLGLVENECPRLLVGPSNSGMVQPTEMLALHLSNLTSNLLLSNLSIEAVAISSVLQFLVADIGDRSIAKERTSFIAAASEK